MPKSKQISIVSVIIAIFVTALLMWPMDKKAEEQTEILFQDFEGEDALFNVTDNVSGSLTDEDVYKGSQSLKYEVQTSDDPTEERGSISFKSIENSVDASESEYLNLYIKDTQGSNTLKVALTDSTGKSSGFEWKDLSTEKDKWMQYSIPMSSFRNLDKSDIVEIRIGQWNEGVYYIDHVYFTDSIPPAPPASPGAFKPSGEYSESVTVELNSKSGKLPIYYTLDGTDPDKNSNEYKRPLMITNDSTIIAVTYDPDSDMYSDYSTFEYVIVDKKDIMEPSISPAQGTYFNSQSITLQTPTEGVTIYYTLDGSAPTESSNKYTEPLHITEDTVIKAIAVKDNHQSEEVVSEYIITNQSSAYLKTDGKILRDNFGSGDQVVLRGTNAGGWLVMEEWMTPVNSPDQKTTIETLTERFGAGKAWELINIYQDNYWQESDFDRVKEEGMNVLRLPFTHFEMLNDDGSLKSTAFDRLDWFINEAEKRELYVILDLHGAPGSQNGKDHSGDVSNPHGGNLYGNEENMNRTIFLWKKVAERYKDRAWVAGYDVLNEPEGASGAEQFSFYNTLYQTIRSVDNNHVIIFEAIWDPRDLPNPEVYQWENVVYSYHFYGWDDIDGLHYQKDFTNSKVRMVNELTNYNVPLLVGEFTLFNNVQSWEYALNVYEEQEWNYTTWTYKVTGLGSSWGIYTGEPPRVDIYNDSEAEIRKKWSQVGTDTSYVRHDYIADVLRNFSDPSSRIADERTLITDFEGLESNVNFETGINAKAELDFENKSDGDASLQLIVRDDSNIAEQYVSIKATGNEVFNMADIEDSFPKYLVFDLYNSTNDLQKAYITIIDKHGNKASSWTHQTTQALENAWSKIPLLLSSIDGNIDKSEIVEIRIAMEQIGTYNIDNIFVGQSFANDLPKKEIEDQDGTEQEDHADEELDNKDEHSDKNPDIDNEEQNLDDSDVHDEDENSDGNHLGIDDENNENNESDKSVVIDQNEKIDPETNSEIDNEKKLPRTASNTYNYLLVGVALMLLGSIFYLRMKKTS